MAFYDSNYKPNNNDLAPLSDVVDILDKTLEVAKSRTQVVGDLISANTKQELEKQVELFKINQAKKDALRTIKLDGLRDKVEDEMINRFQNHPDQMSNRDLLEFMTAVSQQIDKSREQVTDIGPKQDTPIITDSAATSSPTTIINVGTTLDKDSKDNVVGAIKGILEVLQNGSMDQLTEVAPSDDTPLEVIEENDEE